MAPIGGLGRNSCVLNNLAALRRLTNLVNGIEALLKPTNLAVSKV